MTHLWHDSSVTWLICDMTCDMTHMWPDSCVPWSMCAATHVWHNVQGGEDPWDALISRTFPAKEPLIIGPFGGKWLIKIRYLMHLHHPVMTYLPMQIGKSGSTLHLCIYIDMNVCLCIFKCTKDSAGALFGMHIYVHWSPYPHANLHIYIYTCKYEYMNIYIHVCIDMYIDIYRYI